MGDMCGTGDADRFDAPGLTFIDFVGICIFSVLVSKTFLNSICDFYGFIFENIICIQLLFFSERKADKTRLYNFSRVKKSRRWLRVNCFSWLKKKNQMIVVDTTSREDINMKDNEKLSLK